MEQFELQRSSQQGRVCVDHDNKPFTIGCRKCLKIICSGCRSSAEICSDGDLHQMMSLEELVVQLNDELDKLKRRIIEKEESLEKVFKSTSKVLADYDRTTDEMLKKIHNNREKQMESLRLQYQQLEEEFMEARLKTKTIITDYLEDEVLSKWSQLRNFHRNAESRAQLAHDCDVVSGYRDASTEIQRLVEEVLPYLDVPVVSKLNDKGLAITCDKIVAPDRNNKLLIIYSLTGNKIKELSCPQLTKGEVSLCAAGLNKVVVSDYDSSQVFMIDIATDQLLWSCEDVIKPQGVTCYGERYVLVAAYESTTVKVLDSSTGKLVSELTDSAIEQNYNPDMHISGNRLLVANWGEKNIVVFQILP
ncbi:uncharacterized protein [Watersipora subatra]|uniref:uncharacterized protein n=1 Tax=Watersipora subatra TaxID=2589382 RepID=UPI00355B3A81